MLLFVCVALYCFSWFSFCFLSTSQEIGWEDRLQNDLFCVEWDVKPYSISILLDVVIRNNNNAGNFCFCLSDHCFKHYCSVEPKREPLVIIGARDQLSVN